MPTYKTERLEKYGQDFQNLASCLFHQVEPRCGGVVRDGSYSFLMSVYSSEAIAKIIIYEQRFGVEMRGRLPLRASGVYVLIRTNGRFGEELWNDPPWRFSRLANRIVREETLAVAPEHDEQFAYFPVMAGERLGDIAAFITIIMDRANALGQSRQARVAGTSQ
jgi:hypothetical protein